MDLPEGVTIEWSEGFWIAMNYSSQSQEIMIPKNAKILIGSKTLKPADVAVWMD